MSVRVFLVLPDGKQAEAVMQMPSIGHRIIINKITYIVEDITHTIRLEDVLVGDHPLVFLKEQRR